MTTFRVSNQSQLDQALRGLKGGDTILLAGGDYGNLTMNTTRRVNFDFEKKVTIASADPNNPARINELMMTKAGNVEFSNLTFDYVAGKTSSKPFFVQDSKDVTFSRVVFDGDFKDGYATGLGLRVKQTENITVTDSVFRNFANGIDFSNDVNVVLTNNQIRGVSYDGFTLGAIDGALISGNDFRDYKARDPNAAHMDHIQFRIMEGEGPSENVTIRNNVFVDPEGRQGIFFGNVPYKTGDVSAYYKNIAIENNYISTGHVHGVTMFYGTDVDIVGNTIVRNPGAINSHTPLINVSKFSSDVLIKGNTVASVQAPQNASWTVVDNAVSGKRYLHWDGASEVKGDGGVLAGAGARGIAPTVDGDAVAGSTVFYIGKLDFAGGDMLRLEDFDAGTFLSVTGGNPLQVWDNRGAVEIDSVLDLQELSDISPAVTVQTSGDTLTLRVFQDAGVADIIIENMAAAFRASDFPDLY